MSTIQMSADQHEVHLGSTVSFTDPGAGSDKTFTIVDPQGRAGRGQAVLDLPVGRGAPRSPRRRRRRCSYAEGDPPGADRRDSLNYEGVGCSAASAALNVELGRIAAVARSGSGRK